MGDKSVILLLICLVVIVIHSANGLELELDHVKIEIEVKDVTRAMEKSALNFTAEEVAILEEIAKNWKIQQSIHNAVISDLESRATKKALNLLDRAVDNFLEHLLKYLFGSICFTAFAAWGKLKFLMEKFKTCLTNKRSAKLSPTSNTHDDFPSNTQPQPEDNICTHTKTITIRCKNLKAPNSETCGRPH